MKKRGVAMKKTVVYSLVLLMGTAILSILFEYYRLGFILGFIFMAASATAGLMHSAANQDFMAEDITGDFHL
ncbi:hypothetical protein DRW41_17895 [Neobacillus piezotolerans]|uniref:Uncharacterized protein n=1 Tax=Neobacillus piezotolerans TaxID=2259171 RepID=A0A3D8GMA1_9BACI|nr:hypothetical protein [Neobacillus piezotolerans]RDU35604.1 hypothetical protein DRW41_17895 [Neobacillus piezotolerans]